MRLRRFSRRRLLRKVRRFHLRRRRITRARRSSRRRFFRPRSLFPPSIVVTLPFEAMFNVNGGATNAGPIIGGWFLANSLNIGTIATPTATQRGQNSMAQFMGPNSIGVVLNTSTNAITTDSMTSQAANNQPPVALYHAGNIYSNYRVLGYTMKIQLFQGTSTSNFAVLQGCATDDLDLVQQVDLNTNMAFNKAKMQRWTKQRTLILDTNAMATAKGKVPTFYYSCSQLWKLMRDRKQYYSDVSWVGTATPGANGGVPSYVSPPTTGTNKGLYHFFGIQNPTGTSLVVPGSNNAISVYITWTPTVKFFKPHQNLDFVNPL